MNELRATTISDFPVIAGWIHSEALCRQWAGARVGFPIRLDRIAEEIEFKEAESWCLFENDTSVAFGQIVPKPASRQHLARLIVDPEFRGRGFGRVLKARLLEIALSKSPSCVSLNVFSDNTAALGLYQSLGFQSAERPSIELESASRYMEYVI